MAQSKEFIQFNLAGQLLPKCGPLLKAINQIHAAMQNDNLLLSLYFHFAPPKDHDKRPLFDASCLQYPSASPADLQKFRNWLSQQKVTIVAMELDPDLYAYYEHKQDMIVFNYSLIRGACNLKADGKTPGNKTEAELQNFQFILFRKLWHELGHLIFTRNGNKGNTPRGHFGDESGQLAETLQGGGVFHTKTRADTLSFATAVYCRPVLHYRSRIVPEAWIKAQNNMKLETAKRHDLLIDLAWPVLYPKEDMDTKKRKKAAKAERVVAPDGGCAAEIPSSSVEDEEDLPERIVNPFAQAM